MSLASEIRTDAPAAWWRFDSTVVTENVTRRNLAEVPSLEAFDLSVETIPWTTVVSSDAVYRGPNGAYLVSADFLTETIASAGQSEAADRVYGVAVPAAAGSSYYAAKMRTAQLNGWSWTRLAAGTVSAGAMSVTVSVAVRLRSLPVLAEDGSVTTPAPTISARTAGIAVDFFDVNNNVVGFLAPSDTFTVTVESTEWATLSRVVDLPAGTSRVRPVLGIRSPAAQLGIFADTELIEETFEQLPWFDGDTSGAGWVGDPGRSVSVFTGSLPVRRFRDVSGTRVGSFSSRVTTEVSGHRGTNKAMQFLDEAVSQALVPSSDVWRLGAGPAAAGSVWTIEAVLRFDGPITEGSSPLVAFTDDWALRAFGSSVAFAPRRATSRVEAAPAVRRQGVWQHLIVTWSGSELSYFLNGQRVSSYTTLSSSVSSLARSPLRFGTSAVTLAEFAIYSRTMSVQRVQAHFSALYTAEDSRYAVRLNLAPSSLALVLGGDVADESAELVPTRVFNDNAVEAVSPLDIVWQSSDPVVATVSGAGVVTARRPGSARITAQTPGLALVAVPVTVTAEVSLDPRPPDTQRPVFDDDGNIIASSGEYWEVDRGRRVADEWVYDSPKSLATFAWNVATLEGREGIPLTETENVPVGGRAGRRWVPKLPGERVLSMAMWVQGSDPDGGVPANVSQRVKFWENYNDLKLHFGVYDRQILLRRRVPVGNEIVLQEAYVEPASDMAPSMTGPLRGAFTIDVRMSDPFWYESETLRSQPIYSGQQVVVNNRGTHDAKLTAVLQGPLGASPRIRDVQRNITFALVPDQPVGPNDFVIIDFYDKRIELFESGSRYYWMARGSEWLTAPPGQSIFAFTDTGSGSVSWLWQPAYL